MIELIITDTDGITIMKRDFWIPKLDGQHKAENGYITKQFVCTGEETINKTAEMMVTPMF